MCYARVYIWRMKGKEKVVYRRHTGGDLGKEMRGVVYMIKRRGPRTEPCGMPQKQVWREEKLLSHFTRKGREDR